MKKAAPPLHQGMLNAKGELSPLWMQWFVQQAGSSGGAVIPITVSGVSTFTWQNNLNRTVQAVVSGPSNIGVTLSRDGTNFYGNGFVYMMLAGDYIQLSWSVTAPTLNIFPM